MVDKGCISFGRASILVNGSTTIEFDLKRWVRHGDPVSPFLFIIAMKRLNIAIKEACDHHIFRGISLPKNGSYLSHLMYVDDVMFIGELSELNFVNPNRILRCFFLAYGLKVNLHKCKVYGFRVEESEIIRLISSLCCALAKF